MVGAPRPGPRARERHGDGADDQDRGAAGAGPAVAASATVAPRDHPPDGRLRRGGTPSARRLAAPADGDAALRPVESPVWRTNRPAPGSASPTSTPSAQGVDALGLLALVDGLESGGHDPHSLVVARHGHVIARGWWAPYAPERVQLVYSLSKSFTATAVGLLVDEGRLSLDQPVLDLLPPGDLPAGIEVSGPVPPADPRPLPHDGHRPRRGGLGPSVTGAAHQRRRGRRRRPGAGRDPGDAPGARAGDGLGLQPDRDLPRRRGRARSDRFIGAVAAA